MVGHIPVWLDIHTLSRLLRTTLIPQQWPNIRPSALLQQPVTSLACDVGHPDVWVRPYVSVSTHRAAGQKKPGGCVAFWGSGAVGVRPVLAATAAVAHHASTSSRRAVSSLRNWRCSCCVTTPSALKRASCRSICTSRLCNRRASRWVMWPEQTPSSMRWLIRYSCLSIPHGFSCDADG